VAAPAEIIVVGSHAPGLFVRVRRPPVPGETVIGWDYQEPVDGGKGSNQAIAAARLGARVSFVGCVGADRLGDEGERWMVAAGVDTVHLRRSRTASTGNGFIMLAEDGVPAMVTCLGANAELSAEEVEAALLALQPARVLLTQFEISPQVALHAAQVARGLGMTTIVNPAPAPGAPLDGLMHADILVPNESEARQLLGLPIEQEIDLTLLAIRLVQETGAGCVLVTAGERGVTGSDGSDTWEIAPPSVPVVDTSGAGDVFCAALAAGLIHGKAIRAASAWACGVAALSVTREGTIPAFPTLSEAEAFLNS
jgi:ribokinase